MNNALIYLAESGFCLLVFYLFYHLVLKQETCFQYIRIYLLATSFLSFILPLVDLPIASTPTTLPSFLYRMEPIYINVSSTALAYGKASASETFNWYNVIVSAYWVGVWVCSFRLIKLLFSLHQFIRHHRVQTSYSDTGIIIIETQGQLPTFSFLHYIFWDNNQALNKHEKEQILQHEMVHVQQKHSYDVLYLEVLKIFFWFNPLVYLYKKALITTHEYLADVQVLRNINQQEYAALLIQQVFNKTDFSIGNFFNKFLTLKRLKMIMKKDHHPSKIKQLMVVPVLGSVFCFLSFSQISVADVIQNPLDFATTVSQPLLPSIDTGLVAPQFPGGNEAMHKFLLHNLKFKPSFLGKSKIIGTVVFVDIDEKGNFKKLNEQDTGTDKIDREIQRVINNMPRWNPALKNGKAIASRYSFSIAYIDDELPSRVAPISKNDLLTIDPKGIPIFSSDHILISTNRPRTPEEIVIAVESERESKNLAGSDVVFTFVEQPAIFPGGEAALQQFIKENLKYPAEAKAKNISGLVILQFVVDKAGKAKDFKVVKKLGYGTDEEALRVAELFPAFTPAKQNEILVNYKYTLPVRFDL